MTQQSRSTRKVLLAVDEPFLHQLFSHSQLDLEQKTRKFPRLERAIDFQFVRPRNLFSTRFDSIGKRFCDSQTLSRCGFRSFWETSSDLKTWFHAMWLKSSCSVWPTKNNFGSFNEMVSVVRSPAKGAEELTFFMMVKQLQEETFDNGRW